MNDDKYAERCGYAEAQKCIYCIVGNAKLNHEIATTLKATFQQKGIKLLRNQFEAEDVIRDYEKMSGEEKGKMLMPYIQTSLMQEEIVSLEYEVRDGYIKLHELRSMRKDRYSSLAYGVFFIKQQEKKLKKKKKSGLVNLW